MATILKVSGVDFSANAVGFLAPVSSGLVYWGQYGGTQALSLRNLAPSGVAATATGSPTIATNYATFTAGTAFLNTGIAETAGMTVLCVARTSATMAAAASRPMFISNLSSSKGAFLYGSGTTGAPQGTLSMAGYYDVSGTPTLAASSASLTDITSWNFMAGRLNSGVDRTVLSKTTGASVTVADARTRTPQAAATLCVGSAPTPTTYGGACDMAFGAIYNRALSDAEITTIYTFVKALMATKSITV